MQILIQLIQLYNVYFANIMLYLFQIQWMKGMKFELVDHYKLNKI